MYRCAAYDLAHIQSEVRAGHLVIPTRVRRYMRRQSWDEQTVTSCTGALTLEDFHKSVRHTARPEAWIDVYRPRSESGRLYVKVTMHENGRDVLLLSFCIDGEAH